VRDGEYAYIELTIDTVEYNLPSRFGHERDGVLKLALAPTAE